MLHAKTGQLTLMRRVDVCILTAVPDWATREAADG
uniref:Uncharacterized protein n=1 Tax=mine drainage metagenome TaxID=410659 RepID=E6QTT3_9ZZZZ